MNLLLTGYVCCCIYAIFKILLICIYTNQNPEKEFSKHVNELPYIILHLLFLFMVVASPLILVIDIVVNLKDLIKYLNK